MLIFSIFCIINFISILTKNALQFEKVKTLGSSSLLEELTNYISQVLNLTLISIDDEKNLFTISKKCRKTLSKIIQMHEKIALEKLILDSSKVPNDISGYNDCLYNYYSYRQETDVLFIKNNITYIIFSYLSKSIEEDNINVPRKSIFGLCVPNGCYNNDYRFLVYNALIIMYNDTNIFPGLVAYNMISKWTLRKLYKLLLYFIPFYILILLTCFSFFNEYFFNDSSLFFRNIKSCFNLGENVEEVLSSDISLYDSNLFNSSGLSIINGLRAFSILLFILGKIFETFFRSPIANNGERFKNLCENLLFTFMAFCQRFGNKFCYCLSGFTMSYKFICYLDKEIDYIEHNSNNNLFNNNNYLDALCDKNINNYKIYRKKITWFKNFLLFIWKNLFKYFLVWFYALFYKYSFFPLINFISSPGPFWTYFEREVLNYFTFDTMFGMEIFQSSKSKFFYMIYNPFQVAINEINGFIFWTVIIFFFYKNNYRLDLFLIIFILICSFLKLFIFIYCFFFGNMNLTPSKSFMLYINNYILNSFPYNIVYFSIGILFGLINYSFQNSYIQKTSKNFLTIPTKIISYIQKYKKRLIFGSIPCFFFFQFSYFFLYLLYSKINTKANKDSFSNNFWINLFYLFDIEIILFLLFLSVFSFILCPDSKIIIVLRHHYFCAISRPYFTIILCTGLICKYVMYQNDCQILLENQNVLFYSILCIFLILISSLILFIIIEVPLKKISKIFSGNKYLYKSNKLLSNKDNISTSQSSLSISSIEIGIELNEIKNH